MQQVHPRASIFHTRGWLEALRRTYGYEPVAFTTSPPGAELTNALVFCRVSTWLTGRRLVSLPFSDHCSPLVNSSEELGCLSASLEKNLEYERWQYIEIRPRDSDLRGPTGFLKAATFYLHTLDLRPSLDELFRGFHKDCVQRKIRRAEREGLTYEEGRSDSLLEKFYHLVLLTRRRQGLPPQPVQWFRNAISCLGDKLKIRVASKNGQPIASILTLCHKRVLVLKYSCSDQNFNNLGGTQLLYWNAIQEAWNNQIQEFDLGRSDCENSGLVNFKDRWGANRSMLTYWRCPAGVLERARPEWAMRMAKQMLTHMPDGFLTTAGRLLYRHIG
jgi:hypothetical protein